MEHAGNEGDHCTGCKSRNGAVGGDAFEGFRERQGSEQTS